MYKKLQNIIIYSALTLKVWRMNLWLMHGHRRRLWGGSSLGTCPQ